LNWLFRLAPVTSAKTRCHLAAELMILAALTPVQGHTQVRGEYDVKGALIANFAKFIEWPADAFEGTAAPLVLCVQGDGPLENGMASIINQSHAGGRPFRVQRFSSSADCHILFVAATAEKDLVGIIGSVNDRTVTVGEQAGFLTAGGAIEFSSESNRLRFAINFDIAAKAHYRISSKLLALAHIPETDH
jgi:hypothetical protein